VFVVHLHKGAGALPHYLAWPPFALLASATIQKRPFVVVVFSLNHMEKGLL
jgi:hypothetical protein